MYNPPESGADSLEYIEVIGLWTGSINLNGWSISGGIEYTFPNGVSLPSGDRLIIAKDSVAFENAFGIPAVQWDSGSLLNSGEGLAAKQSGGWLVDTMYYANSGSWPPNADGLGSSLIRCNYYNDGTDPANWQSSQNNTGIEVNGITILASPGQAESCTTVDVGEPSTAMMFQTYPNPTAGGFTVRLPELNEQAVFSVHDSNGSLIHYETLKKGTTQLIKEMTLAPGIYILELETDEKQQTQYLVVTE